ncbi:hypothetical protein D3C84_1081250 [compost metagenome]
MRLQTDVALQKLTNLLSGSRWIDISHRSLGDSRRSFQQAIAVERTTFRHQLRSAAHIEDCDLRIKRVRDFVGELTHKNFAVAIQNAIT